MVVVFNWLTTYLKFQPSALVSWDELALAHDWPQVLSPLNP
jgi:hypothetical protein